MHDAALKGKCGHIKVMYACVKTNMYHFQDSKNLPKPLPIALPTYIVMGIHYDNDYEFCIYVNVIAMCIYTMQPNGLNYEIKF